MSDIVEQLRDHEVSSRWDGCQDCHGCVMDDAADEITRLRSELDQARGMVKNLRKALEPFVALRDQSPCELAKVIHKGLDGVTPIAVTVTKDQYKSGCAAFASTDGAADE